MMFAVYMPSCDMIYIQRFMKIGTGGQATLRFSSSSLNGFNVGNMDGDEVHRWDGLKWRDTECKSHGSRLRHSSHYGHYRNNLRGWNICINRRRRFWNMPLGWVHVRAVWHAYLGVKRCITYVSVSVYNEEVKLIYNIVHKPASEYDETIIVDSAQFAYEKGTTADHVACTKLKFAFSCVFRIVLATNSVNMSLCTGVACGLCGFYLLFRRNWSFKEGSQSGQRVNYCHESCGTRNQGSLCWGGPVTI
jgi:hypothetical protein